MNKKIALSLHSLIPPLLIFIVFLGLWYFIVQMFSVPLYILPSPQRVYETAIVNGFPLLRGTWLTAIAAILGFLGSLIVGIATALLFAQSAIVRRGFYPYAIFLQTVPIVAIAPLIVIWFGNGLQSVIIVAFIMGLFPIITNGTMGLLNIKQDLLDLFIVNKASRWQILLKLRFPHAVPYLVTGAKISSGLSVIGAIVGEFFSGYGTNHHGLGYIITVSSGQMKTDYLFAAVFMSTLLSLCFFSCISLIGNLILTRWKE